MALAEADHDLNLGILPFFPGRRCTRVSESKVKSASSELPCPPGRLLVLLVLFSRTAAVICIADLSAKGRERGRVSDGRRDGVRDGEGRERERRKRKRGGGREAGGERERGERD